MSCSGRTTTSSFTDFNASEQEISSQNIQLFQKESSELWPPPHSHSHIHTHRKTQWNTQRTCHIPSSSLTSEGCGGFYFRLSSKSEQTRQLLSEHATFTATSLIFEMRSHKSPSLRADIPRVGNWVQVFKDSVLSECRIPWEVWLGSGMSKGKKVGCGYCEKWGKKSILSINVYFMHIFQ